MPSAPFASLADIEALNGIVDASQHARVATLCLMASDVILAYRPPIAALVALPAGVRIVCAQLVVAVLTAGAARRETLGEYSIEHAVSSTEAMQLTAGQMGALDRALGTSGRGKRVGTARILGAADLDPAVS